MVDVMKTYKSLFATVILGLSAFTLGGCISVKCEVPETTTTLQSSTVTPTTTTVERTTVY